jgi:hypothetical protein
VCVCISAHVRAPMNEQLSLDSFLLKVMSHINVNTRHHANLLISLLHILYVGNTQPSTSPLTFGWRTWLLWLLHQRMLFVGTAGSSVEQQTAGLAPSFIPDAFGPGAPAVRAPPLSFFSFSSSLCFFLHFFKKMLVLPFFFSQFHCVRFCFKCDLYTLSDCTEVMFVPELYVTTGYTNRIFFSFLSFWSFRFVLEILVTTRFNYYCLSFLSVFFQVRFDGIRTFLANPSATLPGGSLGSTHFAVMRDTGSTTVCCSGVDFWSDADAGISTSAVPGGGVVVNADGNGVAVRKIFLSFLTLSDSTHLCPTASSSLCVLCSYFLLPGAFADSAYVCRMETQSHACSTPLFPLPCPP